MWNSVKKDLCNSLAVLLLTTVLLAGCSPSPVFLNQGLVVNGSNQLLENVRIVHRPTNRFMSVNQLLPQESFSLGFFEQRMLGKKAEVSWRVGASGKTYSTELLLPDQNSIQRSQQPLILVYTLAAGGLVRVHLEPAAP